MATRATLRGPKTEEVLHKVLNGVGAALALAIGEREKSEETRKMAKKNEKQKRAKKSKQKRGQNSSNPIYTNPVKNLPTNVNIGTSEVCNVSSSERSVIRSRFLGRGCDEALISEKRAFQ